MKRENLAGRKFGALTAVCPGASPETWECICECGQRASVLSYNLKNGHTRSCGCRRRAVSAKMLVKHGRSGSPTYISWCQMIARCLNPKVKAYAAYGAKGITVCDRWRTFENFLSDMGERPPGKSLDRYPNQRGSYEPSNCRWATQKEQIRNSRVAKFILINGERFTMTEAAKQLGIGYSTLRRKVRAGLIRIEGLHT